MPRTSLHALASKARATATVLLAWLTAGTAAHGAPDGGAPLPRSAPPGREDAAAAQRLLDDWVTAQNALLWKKYAALHAPGFRGTRPEGNRTVTLDRRSWLAERRRMFDQGGIAVRVSDATFEQDGTDGVRVRFAQILAAGPRANREHKVMVLRWGESGSLAIAEEQTLESQIDRTPITGAAPAGAKLLPFVYPNNAPPNAGQPSPDRLPWKLTEEFARTWPDTALGTLRIVLWNETDNPYRGTHFDSEFLGGLAVIRDGRLLAAHYGLGGTPQEAHLIKARGRVIVTVKHRSGYVGETTDVLAILVLTKGGLRLQDSVPVLMNDAGRANSYSCEARVEYRDENGNGVDDIVVTPVRLHRPKSCGGFPRQERRWLF